MEMPGPRSSYTLLSQYPEEGLPTATPPLPPYSDSISSDSKNNNNNDKLKSDRGFDWDSRGDHRLLISQQPRNVCSSLQRQSSGSSYGESSLSGDYYGGQTTLPMAEVDAYGYMNEEGMFLRAVKRVDPAVAVNTATIAATTITNSNTAPNTGSSSGKSWAQQTEESYQLQLALALRFSAEATCADDPNFLDPVPGESALRSSSGFNSPEALSHRFWVNGCMSSFDKVPDVFYLIHGMDPYVWTICTDLQEDGRIPSIESLKSVDPSSDSSLEVVWLIDVVIQA